jgi:hypothetical protein
MLRKQKFKTALKKPNTIEEAAQAAVKEVVSRWMKSSKRPG